jgi:hypothetical protein
MKFAGRFIAIAVVVACLAPVGWAAGTPESSPPYAVIASRNVFDLLPLTNNEAADAAALAADLPKITPNGIMNLFGKLQVIFKVAESKPVGRPMPGQPNKDTSYVMCEGERQDEIEVIKINEADAVVTFNNHGTVQELPLVAAAPGGSVVGGRPGAPGGNPGTPGAHPPSRAGGIPPPMNRFSPPGRPTGGNPGSSGGMPSQDGAVGTGTGAGQSTATPQEEALTPEAQVIMMEAQRAKWQDEGNPAAAIIPPTALTHLNTPNAPMAPGQE